MLLVKFCGILLLIVTFLAPFGHGLRCFKCEGSLRRRDDECHTVEVGKMHDRSYECHRSTPGLGPMTCFSEVNHKINVARGCFQNTGNDPFGCRDVPNPGHGELYQYICNTDNCNAKEPGTVPPPEPNANGNGTAVAQWKTCPNKSTFFVLTTSLITILIHYYIQ